ncbi:MAG: hypothetical protein ACLR3S_02305 [Clostridium fessum]
MDSSQKETSKIRGMSLHVKAGEIVGVAVSMEMDRVSWLRRSPDSAR